jgi:hypothetical protein
VVRQASGTKFGRGPFSLSGAMPTRDEEKHGLNPDEISDDICLAFIDGSLDYTCSACPKDCCRGMGFGGWEQGPISTLIDNHPELLPWIQSREKGFTVLGNPQSGCFFLDNNGLCRIESTSGRSAKPEVCIMFPFNQLGRVGSHLIVRPYFRCYHLEPVVPPRPGSVAGAHSAILKDLQATGMAKQRLPEIAIPASEDADVVLAREREWLAICSDALGRRRLADAAAGFSKDAAGLSDSVLSAGKLLGLTTPQKSQPRDRFDDLLLILSPIMRVDLLMLGAEGLLRATTLAQMLVRQGFTGSAAPATLADLAYFLDMVRPILLVLGRGEEPFEPLVNWQAEGTCPTLDSPEQKMAFGAMVILTGKGYGTLRALEESLSTVTGPLERMLFIRRLATLLGRMPPAAKVEAECNQKLSQFRNSRD